MTKTSKNPSTFLTSFNSIVLRIFLFYMVCASTATVVNADNRDGSGVRVGNGGDWRKIALDQAQIESANWVNFAALNLGMFDRDAQLDKSSITYKFVTHTNTLKNLAIDILNSNHLYNEDGKEPQNEYTTCAWTNDPTAKHLTDIVFSLKLCEGGLMTGGQAFANRLMIHESVHHLLLDSQLRTTIGAVFTGTKEQQDRKEDQLCDDIALAIHRVFEAHAQSGKTHWRDIENPYFPDTNGDQKAFDARGFHVTAWTGLTNNKNTEKRMIIWGGCHEGDHTLYACGDDKYFNDGAIYSPENGEWSLMSLGNAPSPRAEAASAWTGNNGHSLMTHKLIIWGGCTTGDGCQDKLDDGGIYDPALDRWEGITRGENSPSGRAHHSAIWTGKELLVWGGHPESTRGSTAAPPLDDGASYNPTTKTWTQLPKDPLNTPSARGFHTAIWTGNTGNSQSENKMLILGGCTQEIADACVKPFNDAAFYDPSTKTWTKLSASGQTFKARHNHSVTYVEQQARLYIFGGFDADSNVISEGAYLDLKLMRWFPMATMAEGRFKHRAVWAGDKLLVFGGKFYNRSTRTYQLASSVLGFLPGAQGATSQGQWISYKTDQMTPLETIEHSAVWTGFSLLVWGGQIFDRGFTNTGSMFFPGIHIQ